MKTKQIIGAGLLALSLVFSQSIKADQIDKEAKEAALTPPPAGFLVKVNPETKTVEVFRANTLDEKIKNKTATSEETAAAVREIESPANKVADFQLAKGELDKESSTEAWRHRWYGCGYGWNNWGGYRPYYYNWSSPYYYGAGNFYYGYNGCNYNYNYGWNYGYNNCNYGWYY